ncbi:MAG TPA: serine/threonine-protein kinase [Kofleriaceae bacterium]|jgi:serine/threonine protein kinase
MDDREALATAMARRGEVIGNNYVLDGVLGIGGMGVVHVAVQRSLERTVAVKLPRPELAHDLYVRTMFRNEALTGSRVTHRNIVGVLDFGSDAGVPYLVMEHIVGPRLGQLLESAGPLPVLAAAAIVRQVVAGLEDAHASGVVHADVKCDNVLLQTARDGSVTPRLIDFGVAELVDRSASAPRPDPIVTGTPEYVAPEVVRGRRPTPAADVYAVGVMLYELVVGETPFHGETAAAILADKLEADPLPLRRRCPELEISAALDELVSRMLSRDPAERPSDGRDLGRCFDLACPPAELPSVASVETTMFSTEAATEDMEPIEDARPPVSHRRMRVLSAIRAGSVERIATGYLELARELVDRHELDIAEAELEEGVDLLMSCDRPGPVWRLLLSLAALYDHRGEHQRARIAARAARDHAAETGSTIGRERSERLCARLG